MITAVDTSILIDIFQRDPDFAAMSSDALRRCTREGRNVVCDVVWAEVAGFLPSRELLLEQMTLLGIDFLPMNQEAASFAGQMWRQYRLRGGERKRVVADFLVAAHAQIQCDRLLTRDRGFYRNYFHQLEVLDPSA